VRTRGLAGSSTRGQELCRPRSLLNPPPRQEGRGKFTPPAVLVPRCCRSRGGLWTTRALCVPRLSWVLPLALLADAAPPQRAIHVALAAQKTSAAPRSWTVSLAASAPVASKTFIEEPSSHP
jgi:hypothetical protein